MLLTAEFADGGLIQHKGRAKNKETNKQPKPKPVKLARSPQKWVSHMVSNRLLSHSDRKQGLETLTKISSSMALGHLRANVDSYRF